MNERKIQMHHSAKPIFSRRYIKTFPRIPAETLAGSSTSKPYAWVRIELERACVAYAGYSTYKTL